MTTSDGNGSAVGHPCGRETGRLGPLPDLRQTLERLDREAVRGCFDTGRYRCQYFTWGAGPPLVFVPGLSSDARSFALVMARLAPHFRCIAYDLPIGKGDGACLDRYTLDDLAADALALLDHLGEQRGYLVGFSFGSAIALKALNTKPERWMRAVLPSGFARRRLAPSEVLVARLARHWQAPMSRLPLLEAVLRRNHYAIFADRPPEIWRFFLKRYGATPIAAVAQRALLVHDLDLRPVLPLIRQPVLLVSGDRDPVIKATATEELRRGLPRALHIELRECGHHALFTHSAELAELIRQFLSPPGCAMD